MSTEVLSPQKKEQVKYLVFISSCSDS